ncbi:hypothetical protein BQ8794_230065 [Mesorhizobium prunaredense]|uniref:Uncharacterized protein n=1 Tax=Mesorhizobium prunaredense TaxID=1631249 RepID=A0A1R3V770_9HYPH|nr:hypothetical protein BQ8794_230065 [Mesorhizobium prunaredense]
MRWAGVRLIAMYGLFCLVATGANLGVRWLVKTLAIRTGVGVETLPFQFALVSGTAREEVLARQAVDLPGPIPRRQDACQEALALHSH